MSPTESELRRRWTGRVAAAFSLWAVVVVVAHLSGNRPDAPLLGLVVAAAAATTWLFLDTVEPDDVWTAPPDETDLRPPGEDPRLALLRRVLQQHLQARHVGDALQRQLMELLDQRLLTRHGVSWRVDPVRAAALLPPELVDLARQQPPHPRMSTDRIALLLDRIETL